MRGCFVKWIVTCALKLGGHDGRACRPDADFDK